LEQNNKIQQQILKVVLLMIPLDEEELNSEHEVKKTSHSCQVCQGRGTKTKTLQNNKFNIERNAYNLLKPIKKSHTKPLGNLYACPSCRSGPLATDNPPVANTEIYPHVAIVEEE
jgi:hypothetical protein